MNPVDESGSTSFLHESFLNAGGAVLRRRNKRTLTSCEQGDTRSCYNRACRAGPARDEATLLSPKGGRLLQLLLDSFRRDLSPSVAPRTVALGALTVRTVWAINALAGLIWIFWTVNIIS